MNNKDLIEFVLTLPNMKVKYFPRKKTYAFAMKNGGRYINGWAVLDHIKFFFETMKKQKFEYKNFSFYIMKNELRIYNV